jgi:hypothetical protein
MRSDSSEFVLHHWPGSLTRGTGPDSAGDERKTE